MSDKNDKNKKNDSSKKEEVIPNQNQKPQMSPEELKQMLLRLQQIQQQKGGMGNAPPGSDDKNKKGPKLPWKLRVRNAFVKTINGFFKGLQGCVVFIDRFIKFVVRSDDPSRNQVIQYARPPIIFGTYVVIIFFVLGGIWAATAPLYSAAVAVGKVIPSGRKRIIQHPRGGVLKDTFIKQGDIVKKGDTLIELEGTEARMQYETALNRYRTALAAESRLIAERDMLDEVSFNKKLLDEADDDQVQKLMNTQLKLFEYRKNGYEKTLEAYQQQIEQFKKQIEGQTAKKVAEERGLEITQDRIDATEKLLKQGYSEKKTLLDYQEREAGHKGSIAMSESEIARLKEAIAEAKAKILNMKNQFLENVLKELREVQSQAIEAGEQLIASKEILDHILVKSPIDGIINELYYYTQGAAVPGQIPIAEISPLNEKLIIDARVPPIFIDSLRPGLKAKVRFSAFKMRTAPVFSGIVKAVSPDTVVDRDAAHRLRDSYKMIAEDDPQFPKFYVAKIEINMKEFEEFAKYHKGAKLTPGMQAQIQIITGSRTLLRYLLDPVVDHLFKGLKEK